MKPDLRDQPLDILERVLGLIEPFALIAVTDISGGTLRSKGALMAVTQDEVFGYISAGCVDGDIIYQAREALDDGKIRTLVYGEGSPFKDITLPCGGTIQLSIYPYPDKSRLRAVQDETSNRRAATLRLPGFNHEYTPKISLRIAGRGAPFIALMELAHASGFLVHGQSPDAELERDFFNRFDHLKDPAQTHDCFTDPWSAVIFVFHDHDWEMALLQQALKGESFYIGAMGSDRTHALRRDSLKAIGVTNTDRIHGPIGLIPAMRDANRLAISVLAQIIDKAQQQGRLT